MADQVMQQTHFEIIRQQIRDFIAMNFLYDEAAPAVADDASLVGQGIIDPTGVLELALFLEDSYDLHVDQDDITSENFDTINNLTTYVLRQLADM